MTQMADTNQANVYLNSVKQKYNSLRSAIEGLQQRAAEEQRDLSPEELRSVTEMSEQAKSLHTQIEHLTEIEVRNAKVAALNAKLQLAQHDAQQAAVADGDTDDTTPANGGKDQTRSVKLGVGGAQTRDRDPGHYIRGGQHSFFSDLVRSKEYGDEEAGRRLAEHNRALSTGEHGTGVVPPRWLVEEFAEVARQGRALANAVRQFPLGNDPRPLTLPKQTAGTDQVVAEQESENDPVGSTDAWDSEVDTVTPKPTAGSQKVSRQMLDMSSPAIDQLVYADLIGAFNQKVEDKVASAVMAIGTPLQAIEGPGVEVTDPQHYAKVAVRAAVSVRQARKRAPNIWAMSIGRYGEFLNLTDTTGRPLVPDQSAGPANVMGIGSVNVDGWYKNLPIIATEGVDADDEFAAVRSTDVILFESDMLRFFYEQPDGPETIRLGIWAYTAVLIRYGTAPVKRVSITEQS